MKTPANLRLLAASLLAFIFFMTTTPNAPAADLAGTEVIALTTLRPLPGHEEALRHTLEAVRAASLPDPDCLYYFVTQQKDDPTAWELFEVFHSQAAFQAHLQAPGTQAFLAGVKLHAVGGQPQTIMLVPLPGPATATR